MQKGRCAAVPLHCASAITQGQHSFCQTSSGRPEKQKPRCWHATTPSSFVHMAQAETTTTAHEGPSRRKRSEVEVVDVIEVHLMDVPIWIEALLLLDLGFRH